MKVRLLAVGQKMPGWVDEAFADYAKRLPREWSFELVELKAEKRVGGRTAEQVKAAEAGRIASYWTGAVRKIALDEHGRQWTTRELAEALAGWQRDGRDLTLVIGGADGLDRGVLNAADLKLGLSNFTLPHGLVRVVVAEQLYRAASLLAGHPYHRE